MRRLLNTDRLLWLLQVSLFATAPAYLGWMFFLSNQPPYLEAKYNTTESADIQSDVRQPVEVWTYTYPDGKVVVAERPSDCNSKTYTSVLETLWAWSFVVILTLLHLGVAAALFCLRRIGKFLSEQALVTGKES